MEVPARPVTLQAQGADSPLAGYQVVCALIAQRYRTAAANSGPEQVEQRGERRRCNTFARRLGVGWCCGGAALRSAQPGDGSIGRRGQRRRERGTEAVKQHVVRAWRGAGWRRSTVVSHCDQQTGLLGRAERGWRRGNRSDGWCDGAAVSGEGTGEGRLGAGGDQSDAGRQHCLHGAANRAPAQRVLQLGGMVAEQDRLGHHAQTVARC